ncbi:hypothetical protein [Corynebacterium halotolerans]|uniref:Uncharacterized protein n=1 Tax=Corynebacterium halotolerans YIM 70093 = DSM 44683 TaxID=1121362 RepID=M1NNU9_9CORY|nr:hypothetical protein [Corynebacterium halotolerans]AGF71177.1 hypothetical protein A605_00805 [Corynebacterium halotolerans YIM 70093 = DSM 44683]
MSAPLFRPQSTAELKARRDELLAKLAPRTIQDLLALQSIDFLDLNDEAILNEYMSLSYVIGDEAA